MQDKKNIKFITKVLAGYTFRTALKSEESGNILVVQTKDISDDLYIDDKQLVKINHQIFKTNALIKEGDVIISVRGKFRAGVYKGSLKNIIASSSVYILRPFEEKVTPEYLVIYLNSTAGQKEINKFLTGGAIKIILRKDLENINVVIPEIREQQVIVNLYKNKIALQSKLDTKKILINNIAESAISKILNK